MAKYQNNSNLRFGTKYHKTSASKLKLCGLIRIGNNLFLIIGYEFISCWMNNGRWPFIYYLHQNASSHAIEDVSESFSDVLH